MKQHLSRQRFVQLCQRLADRSPIYKTDTRVIAGRWFASVVTHYSEPHRAYHTLPHIAHLLAEFDEVRHLLLDPDATELAAILHDFVYDTKAKTNEEKSAAYAEDFMNELQCKNHDIESVKDIIIETKHVLPRRDSNPDASYLVDMDLAILGQAKEAFDAYEKGIRKEYEWVAEKNFRMHRVMILQSFLERPHIYFTPHFTKKYEQSARRNLVRSIRQLAVA